MLLCENCGTEFDRPNRSKRRTCSRSCAVSLSWKDPATREARQEQIRKSLNTPASNRRIVAQNHKRWAQPGEREKLAALNQVRWADDEFKTETSAHIREAWTPERRSEFSDHLRKLRGIP